MEFALAQQEVAPYGVDLGISGTETDTIRVVDIGVKQIKDSAVNSLRKKQSDQGVPVGEQTYKYPLMNRITGEVLLHKNGKKMSMQLPYASIKAMDADFATALMEKLEKQAKGLLSKATEMAQV